MRYFSSGTRCFEISSFTARVKNLKRCLKKKLTRYAKLIKIMTANCKIKSKVKTNFSQREF